MHVSLFRIRCSHLTVLSLMIFTTCAPLQVTRTNDDEMAFIKHAAERALDFTEGILLVLTTLATTLLPTAGSRL